MTLWLIGVWAQIAQRIVGWTLGNHPDRDAAYVNARIDRVTAERTHR